jgi:ribosomal protein S18 acetylase RimI-like enzyme
MVSRGRIHYPDRLPGYIAWEGGERQGFLTYHVDGDELEIVAVAALAERRGIGRQLVVAAENDARRLACRRVWLVTTNDNMPAQAFYESVGFLQVAVHEGAVASARKLKPEIPRYGIGDVEICDEIEYEIALT